MALKFVVREDDWGIPEIVVPEEAKDGFVNLYLPDSTCFVWLVLDEEDAQPYQLGNLAPERFWLDYELPEAGWSGIIDPPWRIDGLQVGHQWAEWAMIEGIAPGQPFLVKFDPPNYHQCGHPLDPPEWDVSFSWDIVHISKMSQGEVIRRWNEWLYEPVAEVTR